MRRALDEHRITTQDGVELALHRMPLRDGGRVHEAPILLASGTFNGRNFWLGSEGQGMAWRFADAGFDTWILEPRGHGRSQRPGSWLLSDWIEQDAPTAVRTVAEAAGSTGVHWVGHSAGGVVGAAFAGSGHPTTAALRSLTLLGVPGPRELSGRRRWLARMFYWAAAARGKALLPGEPLKLGPEAESAALIRQWLGWNLAGAWRSPGGADYLERLRHVRLPVLAMAGSADHLLAPVSAVRDLLDRFESADGTLVIAGRETGMSRDYGHGGMVLARSATEDIWPLIARWLTQREAAAPQTPDQWKDRE